MIYNYEEVNKVASIGDKVYAYRFKTSSRQNNTDESKDMPIGIRYIQKPVLGVFTHSDNEQSENRIREKIAKGEDIKDFEKEIRYFVPCRKDGKGLVWSKAVTIYSRMFTSDYGEAVEDYNRQVYNKIVTYEKYIDALRELMI